MSTNSTAVANDREVVWSAIQANSYCTLATSSNNRPHAAGILYEVIGRDIFVTAFDDSRKARNVAENPHVAVAIPVVEYPEAPPFSIQFQGRGEILPQDHPEVVRLLGEGRLQTIAGHGVLDDPRTIFIRITPGKRANVYGVGIPLDELMANPSAAIRSVEL
ncbi:MAG: pyridoxamine 5'-phosphate oxidase family protein [Dehalococcoidia bacterium]